MLLVGAAKVVVLSVVSVAQGLHCLLRRAGNAAGAMLVAPKSQQDGSGFPSPSELQALRECHNIVTGTLESAFF